MAIHEHTDLAGFDELHKGYMKYFTVHSSIMIVVVCGSLRIDGGMN